LENLRRHIQTLYLYSYPLFAINSINIDKRDGVVFADEQVLDDTNIKADTLGERRLRTPLKPLYRISKLIKEPRNLISKGPKYYIDNSGFIFYYDTVGFCDLRYHKIMKEEIKNNKIIIKLSGIYSPFTLPRPSPKGYKWVGVLYLGKEPWVLYNFSESKLNKTRRAV
jgi:hypothetical protein